MDKFINKVIQGDCLIKLKELEDNSVDSIVTDPPYEIGFMGKSWDSTGIANNIEMWKECLRVLKPGGHLLAFSGTRTYHRMASAIEDAGFEVRDMIEWVYGSGMSKCNVWGKGKVRTSKSLNAENDLMVENGWEGWGKGGLKPAHEPIVWATKSLTKTNQFAILEDINNNLISTIWQSLENLQKQGTSKLQETVLIHLNTALLWQNILAELLKKESKFTTSTVSKTITELKILNSLLLKNTQDDTDGKSQTYQNGIQESQVNGLDLLVSIVENCLVGEKRSITDIQTLIAQGLVTYKQSRTGMNVKNAEQDLLPIILNANSVLINVLINIITELDQNELNIFVSFAEKSLKQYLAEPQSIADENVWQEHIQKALPNHSPICMARKPLAEKTVAENVLKYGTGGINIDESRVETSDNLQAVVKGIRTEGWRKMEGRNDIETEKKLYGTPEGMGRFPANLIHDNSEEVRECFPDLGRSSKLGNNCKSTGGWSTGLKMSEKGKTNDYSDSGNASRFFKSIIYQAKSSKRERNAGCEELYILKDNTPKEDINEIKNLLSI